MVPQFFIWRYYPIPLRSLSGSRVAACTEKDRRLWQTLERYTNTPRKHEDQMQKLTELKHERNELLVYT